MELGASGLTLTISYQYLPRFKLTFGQNCLEEYMYILYISGFFFWKLHSNMFFIPAALNIAILTLPVYFNGMTSSVYFRTI